MKQLKMFHVKQFQKRKYVYIKNDENLSIKEKMFLNIELVDYLVK